jgi:hypothetical protein
MGGFRNRLRFTGAGEGVVGIRKRVISRSARSKALRHSALALHASSNSRAT